MTENPLLFVGVSEFLTPCSWQSSRDQGLISDEEFIAQRKTLLDELASAKDGAPFSYVAAPNRG